MIDAHAPGPPRTVRTAYVLLLCLIGLLLLAAVFALVAAARYTGAVDQAARITGDPDGSAASERGLAVLAAVLVCVPAVVVASWLGGTSFRLRRPNPVARILTLIGIGLPLAGTLIAAAVAGGASALFLAVIWLSPDDNGPGALLTESPFYQELHRRGDYAWPALSGACVAAAAVCGLAAAILLLAPPSNRWFTAPRHRPTHGSPLPAAEDRPLPRR